MPLYELPSREVFAFIPGQLKNKNIWICWKAVPGKIIDGKQKIDKVPLSCNGYKIDPTKHENGGSLLDCLDYAEQHDDTGIGVLLGAGIVGIDIDDCMLSSGEINETARHWINHFSSYTEKSPSGTGLHILVESSYVGDGRKKGSFEIYPQKRFFTFTGLRINGNDLETVDASRVEAFVSSVFGNKPKRKQTIGSDSPPWEIQLKPVSVDEERLELMSDALDNNDLLLKTWSAQRKDLDYKNGRFDPSSYVQSLANMLVNCGLPDQEIADYLYAWNARHIDKLDKPEKINRVDYYERTIEKARDRQNIVGTGENNSEEIRSEPPSKYKIQSVDKEKTETRADETGSKGNSEVQEKGEEQEKAETGEPLNELSALMKIQISAIHQYGKTGDCLYAINIIDGDRLRVETTDSRPMLTIGFWKDLAFRVNGSDPVISKKNFPHVKKIIWDAVEQFENDEGSDEAWIEYHVNKIADRAMREREYEDNNKSVIWNCVKNGQSIIDRDGRLLINSRDFLQHLRANRDDKKYTIIKLSAIFRSIGYEKVKIQRGPFQAKYWHVTTWKDPKNALTIVKP